MVWIDIMGAIFYRQGFYMEKNEYWDKEEFEDLVATSLIAMYENDINKACLKVPNFIKVNEKDLQDIREIGAYFAPPDRVGMEGHIHVEFDGYPEKAIWSPRILECATSNTHWLAEQYFTAFYLKKINSLPPAILNYQLLRYFKDMKFYKMLYFSATKKDKLSLQKSYITIDKEGKIHDTYARTPKGERWPLSVGTFANQDDVIPTDKIWASCALNAWSDRKHLWNVTAKEHEAKATFGVYPEQIKSLFYAREMPMTETGRKRPILHWVAAHQRRIKKGIDIDIEKYLRGVNEFVYQGTKFIITRPLKIIKH